MRLFPILTAIVVTIFLYFVIFDRDALQRGASDIRELAPVLTETLTSDESEVTAVPDNALPTTDTSAPVSVVVLQSKAQPVQSGIILRGRTEAARRVDVRAETSGKIISEPIRKGAAVVAGQALCEIDPGTRAAQRAEAVARLREAELNAANTTELAEKGFAPETALISAQAALEAAQARIQQIDADIAHLTVTAPFDGMLESDTAELGSLISQGGLCATVIDLSTVKMVGFVPEAQIGLIADNALAGGRLISGREVMGNVTFLSRSADLVTRTFRAEITVDNTDLSIRDGETVEIGIALDSVLGHKLPQSVLTLDDDGRLGVRIADQNVAHFVAVEVLRDAPDAVWLGGLPDQADVIIVGQEFVIDGSPLKVSYTESDK